MAILAEWQRGCTRKGRNGRCEVVRSKEVANFQASCPATIGRPQSKKKKKKKRGGGET